MRSYLLFQLVFSAVVLLAPSAALASTPAAPKQAEASAPTGSKAKFSPKTCAKLETKARNSGKSMDIVLRRKMRLEARGCVF